MVYKKISKVREKATATGRQRVVSKAMGGVRGIVPSRKPLPSIAASMDPDLLKGVIDFHIHSAPDVIRRSLNDIELALKAREAGMRGIVIVTHNFITHDRAYLVRQMVPGIEVFGGIGLNYPVGGLNPAAVEMALKYSGGCMKYIKMPSQAAAHDLAHKTKREDAGGIRVTDSSGDLLPETRKILELAAKADIAVLTGHISPQEDLALVKAAREMGLRKIVINHAMNETQNVPMEMMKRMVEMGAFIEHCYLNYFHKQVTIERYAEAIRELGAEHCIISTDLGRALHPVPMEGLRDFIILLAAQGITQEELDIMGKKNPARLLGLDPWD